MLSSRVRIEPLGWLKPECVPGIFLLAALVPQTGSGASSPGTGAEPVPMSVMCGALPPFPCTQDEGLGNA